MRYLPLTQEDRSAMLRKIGVASIDDLFIDIPQEKRLNGHVDLPSHKSEMEVERILSKMANKNISASSVPFFIGAGAYKHHIPASVDHLIQRSEFLTSYTPYQPEISQGNLQVLFEFQTQIALLTGMEVANASMYDGSTAAAEAVLMAHRVTKRRKSVISGALHPHYVEVIRTLSHMAGDEMIVSTTSPNSCASSDEELISLLDDKTSCLVVQNPDIFGNVRDLRPFAKAAQEKGALLIAVFNEAVSLGLVESPGAMGADIVVGEGQSIGNSLNFGGPYVGLFATRSKFVRQMPGRLCGQTVDASGKRGFVLTLSTREQHIRREKATSNICTNSGLCALAFSIHLTLLGEKGLRELALINHANAVKLSDMLSQIDGVEVLNDAFFNEFTVKLPKNAAEIVENLANKGILGGVPLSRLFPASGFENLLLIAATETNTAEDMEIFVKALREVI